MTGKIQDIEDFSGINKRQKSKDDIIRIFVRFRWSCRLHKVFKYYLKGV